MGGTRRRGRRALALTATIVLGIGLAACGGDDSDDGDAALATEEASSEDSSSDDGGSSDDGTVEIDDVAGLSGECEELVAAYAQASTGLGSLMSGTGTDFNEIAAYFNELADELPDEIADDFEVFGEVYARVGRTLEAAGIDAEDMAGADPATMQALTAALDGLDDPAIQEAAENISAFMEETCPVAG